MSGWNKGRIVGGLVLVALLVVYLSWSSVVQLTATETRGDVSLWLYDSDAAYGGHVAAHVRVDSFQSARVTQVRVYGSGEVQRFRGTGDDELEIDIYVSPLAKQELPLQIDVDYTVGGIPFDASFHLVIDVYSRTTSDLRRGVKALLALVSWFALLLVEVLRRRWYARRQSIPGGAWHLALVPVVAAGWFWFAELLEHVTRLHGWWFVAACLALWLGALALARRWTRFSSTRAYVVEQMMIATTANDAFRGASVQVPARSVADLELAWYGAGFSIERDGAVMRLRRTGRGVAVLTVPASESLGGEAFEIHGSDREVIVQVLRAVVPLLGELRARRGADEIRTDAREV